MKIFHLSLITAIILFSSSFVIVDANALTVKGIMGSFAGSRNGTYNAHFIYHGTIEEKNATHPVIIKIFDKNGTMMRSYVIPIWMLDLNNGTFTYRAQLAGIYPYDIYSLEFSYGNKTLVEPFPFNIGPPMPPLQLGGNPSFGLEIYNSTLLSPLKQFDSGIAANSVVCASGFTLAIRAEDGTPACVTTHTANILVERGWGHMP